jgi:hypothetical protein
MAPYPVEATLRSVVAEAIVADARELVSPPVLITYTTPPANEFVVKPIFAVALPVVTAPAGRLLKVIANGGVAVSDVATENVRLGETVAAEAVGPNALPLKPPCKARTFTV